MKNKVVLLVFVLLLMTGCNIDYNITVNDKKEVEETATVSSTNQSILVNNESINLYLNQQIDTYKNLNNFNKYSYSKVIGDVNSSVTMSREYSSLREYAKSPIFKYVFENATIIENEEYTSFKTVGAYYYNHMYSEKEQIDSNFYIDTVIIKIKFYNKVLENNADEVDNKNNVLTWKITSKSIEKSIYFKINNDKRYDVIIMDFITKRKVSLISFLTIIIVILLTCLIVRRKLRSNNSL
ncbi:MAG: hypothetical protein WC343_03895 [Bacilli bacterium]|jgi:hypothetical protein